MQEMTRTHGQNKYICSTLPAVRLLEALLLLVFCCSNSRSMTPVTWQAAVDDEEQRPLLQDILEAAVDDRRQAAVDIEEQRPQLQDIFEAAIDGNHVYGK